jgi:hypothetical protein
MFYYYNIYIYPYNYTKTFYINKIHEILTRQTKNYKKVTFQYNCKKFDGTSKKNTIYFSLIINYLGGKIKNYRDIMYFVKNKENLLYCLEEAKNAEEKLYESILLNLKSAEYKKPSTSIIRAGSRDYAYRFFPEHIKKLRKLIKLLENSLYFY